MSRLGQTNTRAVPCQIRVQSWVLKGPWPWLIPAFLLLFVFRAYPLGDQFRLSLTNMRISVAPLNLSALRISPSLPQIPVIKRPIGSQFSSRPFRSVYPILGFALALLLNEPIKGRVIYRTAILTSWVISAIIVGYIWRLLLNESSAGVFNAWLSYFGLSG